MSSYSGIIKLAIKPGHELDNSVQLVDQFFSAVLPCHTNTLTSLTVGGNFPTVWSKLPTRHMSQVSNCTLLDYMCFWVAVSTEDVAANRSDVLVCNISFCMIDLTDHRSE
jgi:hypothetical protein